MQRSTEAARAQSDGMAQSGRKDGSREEPEQAMLEFAPSTGELERLSAQVAANGFAHVRSAIAGPLLQSLEREAREAEPAAVVTHSQSGVAYRARIAPLGPVSRQFLFSHSMTALLCAVFGERFQPNEQQSCMTFYREGDHLGPHVDQPAAGCVVTAIAYVATRRPARLSPNTGMVLCVFGEHAQPDGRPLLFIPTEAGTVVFGRGSTHLHERPMLQRGEYVAAITACYLRAPY